ncbi:hypothetical protein K457DRAFT_309634 [Linnemannia elongata AG-77]|uniref:Uncharacterized protein n=1 Tax=Linnemannia elongata AG-77 TaxID=1314771 RepID=A0A197K4P6_9FUNG|nr:hypothetical protein K457DRAFT_309634 [Linnemannia elongata AG-77]
MVATATNRLISFLNRAGQALACYLDRHWCPRYCTTSELYAELLFFINSKTNYIVDSACVYALCAQCSRVEYELVASERCKVRVVWRTVP